MDNLATAGEKRLRAADKRITPQRRLILNILADAGAHLDASDIYQRGRMRDTRLSLSTVYRTLGALKEAGLVRELHLDEEHHHYELDAQDRHSHLVCLHCGCIVEVDNTPFDEVAQMVGERYGFEVTGAQVELLGVCAECGQSQT